MVAATLYADSGLLESRGGGESMERYVALSSSQAAVKGGGGTSWGL